MFEHRSHPLISRRAFLERLTRSGAIALLLLVAALGIGMFGYHFVAGLTWIDSFLDASMILSGMGPVSPLPDFAAKLFAGSYALFSGVIFISAVGVLFVPVLHRILHKFHLERKG